MRWRCWRRSARDPSRSSARRRRWISSRPGTGCRASGSSCATARPIADALDRALRSVEARGFDVVFDAVLGPWFAPSFARLAPEGRYVLYGAADFMTGGSRPSWPVLAWRWLRRPRLDPLALIAANRGLLAFNLIWLWEAVDRVPEAYRQLESLAPAPPHVGGRYRFDDARRALADLQSGTTVGKLILDVNG
jgi:synaptic vesicle membrane protein VAT-1